MGSSQRALAHVPYFEALGGMDESDARWRSISAGLVTLRLFDAWMSDGASVVQHDAWGLRAVREAIASIGSHAVIRGLLTSVVDAMQAAGMPGAARVAPRLMAYGSALQYDAEWALAADVYHTVLTHAAPLDDTDVVIAANMQLGRCYRLLAQWDDAVLAYGTGGQIAALTGDLVNVVKARIAEGKIALDRGNMPRAEEILDDAVARAEEAGFTQIRAMALHDRAVVAYRRQDYERAIAFGYEALSMNTDQLERDRVLGDLAAFFAEMGLRSVARDAYLILAATAQEQYVRWSSAINLMSIAAHLGSEPLFEQQRRALAIAPLTPELAARYHLYAGNGYRLLGRLQPARGALERAIHLAEEHGLNELLFRAEQELSEVHDRGVVILGESPEPSPLVAEVASAIREMRSLVGVGG